MPNGLKMFMSFFDNRELLHRFVSSLSRASRHGNYYGKRRKSESVRLIAGPCVLIDLVELNSLTNTIQLSTNCLIEVNIVKCDVVLFLLHVTELIETSGVAWLKLKDLLWKFQI